MKEVTRKCNICKSSIEINNPREDYIVITNGEKNIYTHSACYIKHYTSDRRRKPKTSDECRVFINECKKNTAAIIKQNTIKEELYNYLFDMYGISFFPKSFYVKMDSIYKGTYKGVNIPIPPEDILDMWKQKRNYLNKVEDQNRKKGKEIDSLGRINYDLAILLSRYDSYLKWKEQQKIAVAELNERKKQEGEKIGYKDVIRPKKKAENTEFDIASMINDI